MPWCLLLGPMHVDFFGLFIIIIIIIFCFGLVSL